MRPLEQYDLAWCLRVAPRNVVNFLRENPQFVVAGGFIRACVAGEKPSDIDIFAPSKAMAEAGARELQGGDNFISTDNAFTVVKKAKFSIQFIHRWTYEYPQQILDSFDFTIAKAAFWWENGFENGRQVSRWQGLCDDNFYPDLAAKRLNYCAPIRNEDAGGSMLRVLKFYQRGYRIPLDSLGAVIARLVKGSPVNWVSEAAFARDITAKLIEVDPSADPAHIAHLPAKGE